jgi:lipopolysaccharide/colanic/teichoic acid biosynthesis glycosyltransferase
VRPISEADPNGKGDGLYQLGVERGTAPALHLVGPHSVAYLRRDKRARYHAVKRILDIALASLTLMLTLPLFVVIAFAIKLNTPGPVFFAQERLRGRRVRSPGGWDWVVEPFTLYKFRTMTIDADQSVHRRYMEAYLSGDEATLTSLRPGRERGDSYRPTNDQRVTRVGAVLRKLSLDELPQLWNVLRGEMSLVGPRPPMPYEVEMYRQHHLLRLTGLPGLTGWAQVKGRCAIGFDDMLRLDIEYLAGQSIWFDLKVLLLTIPVVLSMKGAD